jgi:hypothetical protein
MSIWTNKVIALNDLFTTTETTEDFGTCVTTPQDFIYELPDKFKWATLDEQQLNIDSRTVDDIGSYTLQLSVRLREYPLATPLVVKIPVTIFALSEDIPPPRVIMK